MESKRTMESKRKRIIDPKVVTPVVPPPPVTLESLLTPEGKRVLNNHLADCLIDYLTKNPSYTPQWPSAKHADKANRAKEVPWLMLHASLWPTLAACIVLVLVSVSDHRELRDILVRMNQKMAGLTFVKTVDDASHITLENPHVETNHSTSEHGGDGPYPSSGSGYGAPSRETFRLWGAIPQPDYVHVHLQEACWLSVEKYPTGAEDGTVGKVVKQGVVPKDYEHSFYAKPGWTISVRSGCPGKVDYSYGGTALDVCRYPLMCHGGQRINESKTPSKSEVVTFPL